jgi:hypothetical protein
MERGYNVYYACKKPVVGQKFESGGFDMGFETVQFNTVAIIYEDVFLLCDSVMRVIVKESNDVLDKCKGQWKKG